MATKAKVVKKEEAGKGKMPPWMGKEEKGKDKEKPMPKKGK